MSAWFKQHGRAIDLPVEHTTTNAYAAMWRGLGWQASVHGWVQKKRWVTAMLEKDCSAVGSSVVY